MVGKVFNLKTISIGQGGLVIPPGQYVHNVRLGMDATNDICNLKALTL
jgi:hypothetical protein